MLAPSYYSSVVLISAVWLLITLQCTSALDIRVTPGFPVCFLHSGLNTDISGECEQKGGPHKVLLTVQSSERDELLAMKMDSSRQFFKVKRINDLDHTVCCSLASSPTNEEAIVHLRLYDIPLPPTEASANTSREKVNGMTVYSYTNEYGELQSTLIDPLLLADIEAQLHSMEEEINGIVADLQSIASRELDMRRTTESTFTRIWVCALLLIISIATAASIQRSYLISTIKKKKIM